ncbi:hypothetical protein ACIQHY_29885 [Streptomyces sp. NPDC092359]
MSLSGCRAAGCTATANPAPGPLPHQTYAVLGDGPLDELAA